MTTAEDVQRMFALAGGCIPAQSINAVTKLGIPDYLADGPKTAEQIAKALGANAHAVDRFLSYLATLGVFAREGEAWALTPLGGTLRSQGENSLRSLVLMINAANYIGWTEALHTLRTGEPAFEKKFGSDFFSWLDGHPDEAEIFHAAMIDRPDAVARMVDALDLSGVGRVADIGGGNGHFMSAILARHPQLSGMVVDLAEAIEAARAGQGGPLPRCDLVVASFFEQVPGGADVYILQKILHDWPDDKCVLILQTIRRAAEPGTRLAIYDMVVAPGRPDAAVADIWMYVQSNGRERSPAQFDALLTASGFRMTAVRETGARLGLVEAVAV